jgi:putative transposase
MDFATLTTANDLEAIRRSVNRGAPFGSQDLVAQTAAHMGLEATFRPHGRPQKKDNDANEK